MELIVVDDSSPAEARQNLARVERIDAKRKLTQNRSRADFDGVVAALAEGTPAEQAVATEMRRETPPT